MQAAVLLHPSWTCSALVHRAFVQRAYIGRSYTEKWCRSPVSTTADCHILHHQQSMHTKARFLIHLEFQKLEKFKIIMQSMNLSNYFQKKIINLYIHLHHIKIHNCKHLWSKFFEPIRSFDDVIYFEYY